jgi:hypothetical protein
MPPLAELHVSLYAHLLFYISFQSICPIHYSSFIQVWIHNVGLGSLIYSVEQICDDSGEDPECSRSLHPSPSQMNSTQADTLLFHSPFLLYLEHLSDILGLTGL